MSTELDVLKGSEVVHYMDQKLSEFNPLFQPPVIWRNFAGSKPLTDECGQPTCMPYAKTRGISHD